MKNKTDKQQKFNFQIIFNILVLVNLVIGITAIIWTVKIGDLLSHISIREAYSDLILRTKIDCVENPSENCKADVEKFQKLRDDLIKDYFKDK